MHVAPLLACGSAVGGPGLGGIMSPAELVVLAWRAAEDPPDSERAIVIRMADGVSVAGYYDPEGDHWHDCTGSRLARRDVVEWRELGGAALAVGTR